MDSEFFMLEKTFEMASNHTAGKCPSFQVDEVYGIFSLISLHKAIFWAQGFIQLLMQHSPRATSSWLSQHLGWWITPFFFCPLK